METPSAESSSPKPPPKPLETKPPRTALPDAVLPDPRFSGQAEICVSGLNVASGYLNRPELTATTCGAQLRKFTFGQMWRIVRHLHFYDTESGFHTDRTRAKVAPGEKAMASGKGVS
ncbi:hypothetical protein ACH492_04300 [Streptomyces sp. NPDC019443]|uniref:hypothetical protein n=1 Tax=Streptomyces sp. NPDC019443 TaxID=3365061 RepID=UPI003793B6F5